MLLPLPVAAGAPTDLLMAPHLFDGAPVGAHVAYAEERTLPGEGSVKDVAGGDVRLEVVAAGDLRELRLTREDDGRPDRDLPGGGRKSCPALFLETTVRATAEATGGSPYYIRNRIREALAAAGPGAGANAAGGEVHAVRGRSQLGAHGRLRRSRYRAPFRPGAAARILELSADTPGGDGGYHESLALIAED